MNSGIPVTLGIKTPFSLLKASSKKVLVLTSPAGIDRYKHTVLQSWYWSMFFKHSKILSELMHISFWDKFFRTCVIWFLISTLLLITLVFSMAMIVVSCNLLSIQQLYNYPSIEVQVQLCNHEIHETVFQQQQLLQNLISCKMFQYAKVYLHRSNFMSCIHCLHWKPMNLRSEFDDPTDRKFASKIDWKRGLRILTRISSQERRKFLEFEEDFSKWFHWFKMIWKSLSAMVKIKWKSERKLFKKTVIVMEV